MVRLPSEFEMVGIAKVVPVDLVGHRPLGRDHDASAARHHVPSHRDLAPPVDPFAAPQRRYAWPATSGGGADRVAGHGDSPAQGRVQPGAGGHVERALAQEGVGVRFQHDGEIAVLHRRGVVPSALVQL